MIFDALTWIKPGAFFSHVFWTRSRTRRWPGTATGQAAPVFSRLSATRGNAGISLAIVAAVKRYPFLLAMNEGVSVERRKILAAMGVEFLLAPAIGGGQNHANRSSAIPYSSVSSKVRLRGLM